MALALRRVSRSLTSCVPRSSRQAAESWPSPEPIEHPSASRSSCPEASVEGSSHTPSSPTVSRPRIGDLVGNRSPELRVRGKWAELLPSIPEGENYLFHTERGAGEPLFGWRRRFWNFLLKLAKSEPSWTIQAQPGPATGPFHWENRLLSVRELARLQTCPDDVQVFGSRASGQRQIGNAVPSLLAEVIGREIRRQLLDGPVIEEPPRLLPRRRRPIPAPARVKRVPDKYLHLRWTDTDHPGTGLGRRAQFAFVDL